MLAYFKIFADLKHIVMSRKLMNNHIKLSLFYLYLLISTYIRKYILRKVVEMLALLEEWMIQLILNVWLVYWEWANHDFSWQDAFVDVTLACDGKSFSAHKVVLSACSPYFQVINCVIVFYSLTQIKMWIILIGI